MKVFGGLSKGTTLKLRDLTYWQSIERTIVNIKKINISISILLKLYLC